MVVSDIGDTWSPKIPPEITAPIISGVYISKLAPRARAIGIIIEKVPQLVPVEKDVIADTKKTKNGRRYGEILPSII